MSFSVDAITLGVLEPDQARRFYIDGFGLTVLADHGDFVSLGLGEHSAPLSLYANDALAADAQTKPDGDGFRGFTISYLVEQPAAVDLVVSRASAAGAQVIKPAKRSMWGGYSGVSGLPTGPSGRSRRPTRRVTRSTRSRRRPMSRCCSVSRTSSAAWRSTRPWG
jgi:catechol 2,3-dioxygenase-like lactoylglutathione lyase family enzyme